MDNNDNGKGCTERPDVLLHDELGEKLMKEQKELGKEQKQLEHKVTVISQQLSVLIEKSQA